MEDNHNIPPFQWTELLTQWSQEMIAAEEYRDQLPPEVIAAGWLGYPGATEEQIAAAEARLGTTFPPSYRAFLKISNGWRKTTGFIDMLWPAEQIEWFATRVRETIDAWVKGATQMQGMYAVPPISDAEYLVYGESDDQPFREAYLQTALEVSAMGDGIYLLNPKIVTAEGEWEAWFFAHWIPGAQRYRSFWKLMQAEHDGFLYQLRYDRGEPTPHVDPALGVDARDLDGLIAALGSPHQRDRHAAIEALGNLRDPRAVEPLLATFQNPDEVLFVRERAAVALGMLRDERALAPLIASFRTRPDASDMKLKTFLGNQVQLPGGAEMFGALGELSIKDFLEQMQGMFGGDMLNQIQASLTPDAVSQGIGDHLNHAVGQALLEFRASALPALFAALKDADPAVRAGVARTLCYARGQPEVFEHVSAALHDPDATVRAAVATNLEQLFDARALDPLLGALQDPASEVRSGAAVSLGAMARHTPDARIVPALRRMAQHDPDPRARAAATQALAFVPN